MREVGDTINKYSFYRFMMAMTQEPTVPDESQIRALLRQVVDPEIGKDIVAIGLVYRIDVAPGAVLIEMTMTSPACPMGEMILDDVRTVLGKALPPPVSAEVRLVWEPPWSPALMDAATRQEFGWSATASTSS